MSSGRTSRDFEAHAASAPRNTTTAGFAERVSITPHERGGAQGKDDPQEGFPPVSVCEDHGLAQSKSNAKQGTRPAPGSSMLTKKQIDGLRRRLLKKGSEINEALTWLLAGEKVDVEKLLGGGKPGETPEEKLRRFLNLIDDRIQAIARGQFGLCEECRGEIPFNELDEVPWQKACRHCALAEARSP